MSIDLKKLLPQIMQNDFWNDFVDSVATELQNLKDQIAEKELFYNTSSLQTDENQLIDLAKSMGYIPDRSLHPSDIDHLRRDVASIPFRVKYKSTYLSYFHIFKFIPYSGEVFLYFWNTVKLVKAHSEDNFTLILTHDPSEPFQFKAELNYVSFLFTELYLDYTPPIYFDDPGFPWFFDQTISRVSTKHLAVEYVMDKLLLNTEDNKYYGTLPEYMNYLLAASLYNKEATEVPHIGLQVTGIMDTSQLYDAGLHREDIFKGTINLVTDPEDLSSVNWTDSDTIRTLSNTLQVNDLLLTQIEKTTALSTCYAYQDITGITDTEIPFQCILRRGTATGLSHIVLYDTVGLSTHIDIDIDWSIDSIILNTGTLLRYEWIDVDTVWISCISTTLNPLNNQQLQIYPAYYSGESGAYIYATGFQLENYNYPTPYIKTTRQDVKHQFTFTLPDKCSIKLKIKKAWFTYDVSSDRYIYSWYIDGTHYFTLAYDQSTDKFILRWIDGTTERYMESQQFDDGTSWDNINQEDIIIFISADFTTGTSSGSRFIVIDSEQTYEATTWSGSIDVMSSAFNTLEVGAYNTGNNYFDGQISYIYIYDDITTELITDETSLDLLLAAKTLLYSKDLQPYTIAENYYSMPSIKLKSTLLPGYDVNKAMIKLVAGNGRQDLPGKYENGTPYPSSLQSQIAEVYLHVDERDITDPDYSLYMSEIRANTIINEIIDTGDGISTLYSDVLNYSSISPKTLIIQYTSNLITYTIADLKGTGYLEGTGGYGYIDYILGQWTLNTEKITTVSKELIYTGSTSSINEYVNHIPVITNSVILYYKFGGVLYVGVDDGAGNITGYNISSGSINYSTGLLQVTFSSATDIGQNIYCTYNYQITTIPDIGTDIIATQYSVTNNSVDLTEAGLIDEDDNLVAYMTFPPLRMGSEKYHASFQFFIKKSAF